MMDYNFLPFFIRENIYLVDEPDHQNLDVINDTSPDMHAADASPKPSGEDIPAKEINKSLIVITNSKDDKGIDDNERQLLEKILNAIQYTLNDINLFNYAEINELKAYQSASETKFLGFGIPPEDIIPEKNHPYYQVYWAHKNKGYLFADTLQALINDRNKKKKLWEKLKELFF